MDGASILGARGESTLTLPDGREVRILFTNRALADVETHLGKGILNILREFQDGGGSVRETLVLLRFGMQAARRELRGGASASQKDAEAVMDEIGFANALTAVMEAIAAVLGYGTEDGGGEGEPDGPPA